MDWMGERMFKIYALLAIAVTVIGCGGGNRSGRPVEAFCTQMRALDAEYGGNNFNRSGPRAIRDALAAIDAPDELVGEFAILVGRFGRVIETGLPLDRDDRAETIRARTRIERYVSDECGFELNDF